MKVHVILTVKWLTYGLEKKCTFTDWKKKKKKTEQI